MAVLRLPNKTQIQFIFLQGNKFFYFLLNKKKMVFGIDSLTSNHVMIMDNTLYIIGALIGLSSWVQHIC